MNNKLDSIEPFAEQVFKAIGRMMMLGVLAFAAAHLSGLAELIGAGLVSVLLVLATLALVEPLVGHAIRPEGKLSVRVLRGIAFLVLAFGATLVFMFGFVAVLPFSG